MKDGLFSLQRIATRCRLDLTLAIFIAISSLATNSAAQTNYGQINGTVVDPSGASVVDATVVLTAIDTTGVSRTVSTTPEGAFLIPVVPPGHYTLNVRKAGFEEFVLADLNLQVNESRTIDIHLTVGASTQTVTVEATSVSVNQTDASLGSVIQREEVVDIPLNGRSFSQLVVLSPGVPPTVQGQQSTFDVNGGYSYSVNGMRFEMNNFTLDGIENNMRWTNTFAVAPPPDAIAEFKVATHQSDAASTLAAGANINVLTRGGDKFLHGSIWEFARNQAIAANGYFNNLYGNDQLPYKQNQFGGFLGGPVFIPHVIDGRASGTYFSGYYEGLRYVQDFSQSVEVPSAAERQGDFSELLGSVVGTDCLGRQVRQGQLYDPFNTVTNSSCPEGVVKDPYPNNVIPKSELSSVAQAYLATFYPLPTMNTAPNLVYVTNDNKTSNQWGVRLDHSFSDRQQIFGRVNRYAVTSLAPSYFSLPLPYEYVNTGINVGLHYSLVINPRTVFQLSGGYNRASTPWRSVPQGRAWSSAVGTNFAIPMPNGFLPATQGLDGSQYSYPQFFNYELANPDDQYQLMSAIDKVTGNHHFSAGFQIFRWQHHVGSNGNAELDYSNETTGLPSLGVTGESSASFLVGLPTSSNYAIDPPQTTHGLIYVPYLGDTWKAKPWLSLNLGLQYVYATRPVGNLLSGFDYQKALTQPTATDFSFAYLWTSTNPITGQPANATPGIISPDRDDVAPRLGIVVAPFKNTAVRAGFGVFYDFNTNLEQNSSRGYNYPYTTSQVTAGQNLTTLGPANPVITLANPYVPATPSVANLPGASVALNFRDPYAMEWNFGLEQSLPWNVLVSANYVGSAGRKLTIEAMENIAPVGTGPINPRRPFPNAPQTFMLIESAGTSNYHALQLTAEKRYAAGLTFREAFTYGKTLDLESDPNAGTDIDYIYDQRRSYARADWDMKYINAASVVYALPFGRGQRVGSNLPIVVDEIIGGWRFSGIVSLHTGTPFYVVAGQDIENTGNSLASLTEPAELVGNPYPMGFKKSRIAEFDTTAFALPAFGTLGNEPKNSLSGPGYEDYDLGLGKDFRIWERLAGEFRGDFFNAFNHTNFSTPYNSLSDLPLFGQSYGASAAREIQLSLRLHW
jgi:hypothetical protein